jgi:murein DD-endopeptidase MepM/ murein hydrolase activator NlpD
VRATAAGTIVKLFTSKRGGITIYQRDVSGRYVFYYAHLSGYSVGLKEGMAVEQGQVIAQVGQTATPRHHIFTSKCSWPTRRDAGGAARPSTPIWR